MSGLSVPVQASRAGAGVRAVALELQAITCGKGTLLLAVATVREGSCPNFFLSSPIISPLHSTNTLRFDSHHSTIHCMGGVFVISIFSGTRFDETSILFLHSICISRPNHAVAGAASSIRFSWSPFISRPHRSAQRNQRLFVCGTFLLDTP
jgi:hypothetical protein